MTGFHCLHLMDFITETFNLKIMTFKKISKISNFIIYFRPRKREDWQEIIAVFSLYKDEIRQAFRNSSDPVWSRISIELEGKIKPKYAYLIISENRNNIWTELDLQADLAAVTVSPPNSATSSLHHSTDSCSEFPEQMFTLIFKQDEFSELIEQVEYGRTDAGGNVTRTYTILSPYVWTDKVYDKFFAATRLPCAIAFKRNKILPWGNTFLTICGTCSSCQSKFIGTVSSMPNYESNIPVVMDCKYTGNFHECTGQKKRKLLGDRKKTMVNKMIKEKKSAAYIRSSAARKTMAYGEKEPSHIPTSNALRIAKCRGKKESFFHDNPLVAVSVMKRNAPYNTIIRDIGMDRFFIHYWSASEANNYRSYCKNNVCPTISIDATGGCIRRFTLPSSRRTSHIFLYEIVVHDKANMSYFSVAHMLSERHDNNSIGYWLTEWLRDKIEVPRIAVMDQSLALMMAAVRSFTQYSSLAAYSAACFALLKHQRAEVPVCMIRNDVNHIMHLISTWPMLKTASHPRFKKLYMHSMGLLVTSTDYNDAKVILRNIFTIALYINEGTTEFLEPNSCEKAKTYLQKRISGSWREIKNILTDDDDDEAEVDNPSPIEESDETVEEPSSFYQEIQSIYLTVKEQSEDLNNDGDRANVHYSPDFATKLLHFCRLLPYWTGIMVPIFGYGQPTETSSIVESVFNHIKNRLFQHFTLPIRVDEFIQKHIDTGLGAARLAKSKEAPTNCSNREEHSENKQKSPAKTTESTNIIADSKVDTISTVADNDRKSQPVIAKPNNEEQYAEENWRGLINRTPKKKTYLQPNPLFDALNLRSKAKNPVIGILKNGSMSSLSSVEINRKYYTLTNTCAFDSIVQIFCVAYADSVSYRSFIDKNKSPTILFQLVANMIRDGVTTQAYRKRANILKRHFKPVKGSYEKSYLISAETTASYLASVLFNDFPSFLEKRTCGTCLCTKQRKRLKLIANISSGKADDLQNAVNVALTHCEKPCEEKCSNTDITDTSTVNEHLIIEPATPHANGNYVSDLQCQLGEIPTKLSLCGKTLTLRGVVEFIPPDQGSIGHYIAHCWREDTGMWQTYNDLANSVEIPKSTLQVEKCQLIVFSV